MHPGGTTNRPLPSALPFPEGTTTALPRARVASVRLADDSTRRRERAVELAGRPGASRDEPRRLGAGRTRGHPRPRGSLDPSSTVPRQTPRADRRRGARWGRRAAGARWCRSPRSSFSRTFRASSFPARARVLARDRVRSRRRARPVNPSGVVVPRVVRRLSTRHSRRRHRTISPPLNDVPAHLPPLRRSQSRMSKKITQLGKVMQHLGSASFEDESVGSNLVGVSERYENEVDDPARRRRQGGGVPGVHPRQGRGEPDRRRV